MFDMKEFATSIYLGFIAIFMLGILAGVALVGVAIALKGLNIECGWC